MRDRIVARIESDGPLPFDEYMAMCLYDPEAGFFSAGGVRPGVGGDFVTSPEVSPWFGRLVGRWAAGVGAGRTLVEIGAGSGALLEPLLEDVGDQFASVHAIEVSEAARAQLSAAHPDLHLAPGIDALPEGDLVVVMNEVLDNIPAKLVERCHGEWSEILVGEGEEGLELIARPADPELAAWAGEWFDDVPEGARLAAPIQAVEAVVALLDRSAAVALCAIDYAADTAVLAARPADRVVRTFRGHREGNDALADPGATDITVEVNIDVMRRATVQAGATIEVVPQHEFLRQLGADAVLAELDEAAFAAAHSGDVMLQLRHKSEATDLRALLDPAGLGGFEVFLIESGT